MLYFLSEFLNIFLNVIVIKTALKIAKLNIPFISKFQEEIIMYFSRCFNKNRKFKVRSDF